MQLDDDDYYCPGSRSHADGIRSPFVPEEAVLPLGVGYCQRRRGAQPYAGIRQSSTSSRHRHWSGLLRNSSFVREPAVVVRRAALEREGLFDPGVGGATDTDMWVKLFARYGVRCFPTTTCAYTIHEAAATTGMWNQM
jgi:hypothetical protein